MDELFTPAMIVYTVSVVGAVVAARAFRSVHKKNVEQKRRLRKQQAEKPPADFMTSRFGKTV
jgi:hypothetical protein